MGGDRGESPLAPLTDYARNRPSRASSSTKHPRPLAGPIPPVEPTLLLTRPSRSPIFLITILLKLFIYTLPFPHSTLYALSRFSREESRVAQQSAPNTDDFGLFLNLIS
jgi:hypothetical protein